MTQQVMNMKMRAPIVALALALGAAAIQAHAAPEAKKNIEIYGQVMLDAIYDANRMNPTWNATLRPSQIPVNCPGDAGCGKDGTTLFSIRQSSLGVRTSTPSELGEVKTEFSFDLFGSDGSMKAHWLHVWAEVGMFGAGQYDSLLMDMDTFPNTIDYWGPSGRVFVRNPQLRITPVNQDGMKVMFSLESPSSALDTGKFTQVDPDWAGGVTGWNTYPDAIAAARFDRDWGHLKVAGILREVGYQSTTTASGDPSGHELGYGVNLTGSVKAGDKDSFTWQLAGGNAIASYMNDGGVDLAPNALVNPKAQTLNSLGWFVYYNRSWSSQWSSAMGYSEHRQDNAGGQLDTAFKQGSYASANLLYYPAKNVTTGAELMWGQVENKGGQKASDHRFQFSTKVTF